MSKKAIKKLDLREGEARLWKDERDGSLSVSIDDPWDGFVNASEVARLGRFLLTVAKTMRSRKVSSDDKKETPL